MKTYVVRVVQTKHRYHRVTNTPLWLEKYNNEGGRIAEPFLAALDKAGLIVRHETDHNGPVSVCFDIVSPHKSTELSMAWARDLSKYMQESGFNAVVAPTGA